MTERERLGLLRVWGLPLFWCSQQSLWWKVLAIGDLCELGVGHSFCRLLEAESESERSTSAKTPVLSDVSPGTIAHRGSGRSFPSQQKTIPLRLALSGERPAAEAVETVDEKKAVQSLIQTQLSTLLSRCRAKLQRKWT